MNVIIAAAGIAIFAAVCSGLIQKSNREIAILFSAAAAILVFLYVLPQVESLLETLSALAEAALFTDTLSVLIKALGVAIVARIAVNVCRDAGESALASGVEFAAKATVLLLAVPFLQQILVMIQGVLL